VRVTALAYLTLAFIRSYDTCGNHRGVSMVEPAKNRMRQCLRTARSGVWRTCPSRAKREFASDFAKCQVRARLNLADLVLSRAWIIG
jgi:hypothetical protein